MEIYVVGAGMMGRGIIVDLLKNPEVSKIIVGDRMVKKAKKLVDEMKDERLSVEYIDVTEEKATVKKIKGFDVVVYAGWYEFNMPITRAAIEAGVNYMDLGGLYHKTLKQLELDESAKKAGITAILGIGTAPGMTNVLTKYGADKMDRIEEIHIRLGAKQLTGKPKFEFGYSIRTILDEFLVNPVVYKDGKYVEVEPLSGWETAKLPDPMGDVQMMYTIHSEIATVPKFIDKGVKLVDWKIGFSRTIVDSLRTLIDLGFTRTEPITYKGIKIVPLEFTATYLESIQKIRPKPEKVKEFGFALWVDLKGKEKGERVERRISYLQVGPPRYPGLTEISASIAAQMLAKGIVKAKGALPPEACIDPEQYIAELAKKDIRIQEVATRSARDL